MSSIQKKRQYVNIDEMLHIVGDYGRFQKLVNLVFCVMTLPSFYHVMITYFAADDPDWKCVSNSSVCRSNGTFESTNSRRCHMDRSDWEYTKPKEYSVVTYFDINCNDQWMIELVTSIFFLGWVLGSFILGIICDVYGRKLVLTVSMTVVITTGFISIFMPNLYSFIICRFIIGFFLPGTNVQIFIIITELVGSKYRGFAGLSTFACGVLSLTILGIKAYLIPNWKHLHIACTVPYIFIILFFKFIPESARYLRVKGKMDELMVCFERIAYWNKKVIPSNIEITSVPIQTSTHHSTPIDLFRTIKLASKTSIQIFAMFATGLSYYGLYMAAGDIGGSMYRDYILISVSEIPVIFLSIDFCERFGRKKTSTIPMIIGSVACIGLAFIPNKGALKILRVATGMVGKCSVGSNMNTMSTWSSELYPTVIRGEAMGIFQASLRLGAAAAPWLDKELAKVHKSASFLFMTCICLVSFCFLNFLPETKGVVSNDENVEPEEALDDLNLEMKGISNEYAETWDNGTVNVVEKCVNDVEKGVNDVEKGVNDVEKGTNSFTNPALEIKE